MKTLIIFASKTGTTEKCATKLKNGLKESELFDLNTSGQIDLKAYDQIIIGSPIRMGRMDKKVKLFLSQNTEQLKQKKFSLFFCCCSPQNKDQYLKENIPATLNEDILLYDTFGGEMDVSKQKGIDKWIAKMVLKASSGPVPQLLEDHIKQFIEQLNKQ